MRNIFLINVVLFFGFLSFSQTKVSGYVYDEFDEPVAYANVIFKDSKVGTITDENGKFYLESDNNYNAVEISFMGFKTYILPLEKNATYDIKIKLESDAEALSEVMVYTGKTSKENNPALDILRKIWENRRENGVKKFDQYQYDKYEKLQFDLNTIDSSLINSRLFKGMEFIFTQTDTNKVTGKTYLPIFINESVSKVYGDNFLDKEKEVLRGNKNSGFSSNQNLIAFIKDLYAEYNVYDNYIKIFDKSFVSPISTTGIDNYNYVLADSAYIGDRWSYNIVYYPRRKNELTFKGEFWVNDTTWAIKKIDLAMTKSANINWVKDVYIEQEFDVLNDSIFLITRDYFMTDFTFRKKEDSRGVYGKRTTLYDNYKFDEQKDKEFYDRQSNPYENRVFDRDSAFWAKNRLEKLNKDEKEIYTLVDTLKTVKAFKQVYDVATVLATNYWEFDGWDFGPVFSTFGFNDIEGLRLRVGGRTYFSQNDTWRLQGFTAYGFKDDKFKYGLSGKVMLDRQSRLILSGGNRRDVEQLGASLTSSNDVLGRSLLSGTPFMVAANNTLTNINLSSLALQFDPFYNFNVRLEGTYRTLVGADTDVFSLAYYTDEARTQREEETVQTELSLTTRYTPNRKATGYGVEQYVVNAGNYPEFMLKYTKGLKGVIDSDFNYDRLQLLYRQPILLGGFGRFTSTLEAGKTFGGVPLGLLNVVPGNQTLFTIEGTFPLLDFYEFVTDEYVSLHMEHNFNGRLFARIPLLRDLDLREIVTFRSIYGQLSDESRLLNASTSNPVLFAPDRNIYYSYSFGIGNIFRVFRLDFHFRGNYFDIQDSRSFGITGAFGFYF
ncbi:DUF5686 and carboxypeptidase-like regulatory domain-containing protein [Mesohalobacter halotolerans]|uniref:Carboxypeptidase-like regulatory domain-containing protein n=1 Tax=Mesohalobacter halotolerans TaxID=1883405 RepID=A0A4U5TSS3_9FLAO|nr:DUF5686 and carboxypeptidase-like regulatory domain-containing protein [Mesohalobacter halotolerans]TKS57387.1 carboxypeptidase-like regulatory domain-containing protein [Mesohalobacter halotolerans]